MAISSSNFVAILVPGLFFFLVINPLRCEAGNVWYGVEAFYPVYVLQYNETNLTLEANCNLMMTNGSGITIWQTNTSAAFCNLTMENNGSLALYDEESRNLLWATNEAGLSGDYVLVLGVNQMAVYGANQWDTNSSTGNLYPLDFDTRAANVLFPGQVLNAGDSLWNGKWNLLMERDCNLVLYEGVKEIWSSNTSTNETPCHLKMELTGDLVIYDQSGNQIWASDTSGVGRSVLVLRNDGNMVIYGPVVWETGTISISSKVEALPLLLNKYLDQRRALFRPLISSMA